MATAHLHRLAFDGGASPVTFLVRDIGPLVLSLSILTGICWLSAQRLQRRFQVRVLLWYAAGALTFGVTGFLSGITVDSGQPLLELSFALVWASATGGAGVGLLVGVYDVQSSRRDHALLLLHDVTQDLLEAHSKRHACEITVDAAQSIIGLSLTGLWLRAEDRLEPVVMSQPAVDRFGDYPTFERGESLAWAVYERGEPTFYTGLRSQPDVHNPDTDVRSEYIVPIGDHGVLLSGSFAGRKFTPLQTELARLLAAHTELVLDRIDRTERLKAREAELEAQNERLDRFAGVVSHDLRNPLNVADGYLELARESHADEHFAEIRRAIDRMDDLVDDLLALFQGGDAVGETEPLDLHAVATDACADVDLKGVSVEVADGLGVVEADESRLRQLFENLFRNVVEHAAGATTIRIAATEAGFAVVDDGAGIPEADREAVFEYGHTGSASGTGLGLAIVREVADGHGWDVSVETGRDGGARFAFTVPDLERGESSAASDADEPGTR